MPRLMEVHVECYESGKASLSDREGHVWCGPRHEWVHPDSSYFQGRQDLWNVEFDSPEEALAFAREKGWVR